MRDRILTGLSALALVACSDPENPPSRELASLGGGPPATGTGTVGSPAVDPSSGITNGDGSTPAPAGGVNDPGGSPTGGSPPSGTPSIDETPGAVPPALPGSESSTPPAGGSGATGSSTGSSTVPTSDGLPPEGAGATAGVVTPPETPEGSPTCASGVQTGSSCNPSADIDPCVRSDRTCECDTDSVWDCMPTGAAGAGATPGVGQPSGAGGMMATDGAGGTVGAEDGAGGGGSTTVDIDCDATMPTSAGEQHSATWAEGGSDNLAWQIWTNGGPGNLTTYDGVPAFLASWNNSGDYLGRMGFEWGNSGRNYSEYGTITADYVWNKSGTAGQYSYIGIYGWSNNPCVEWYIVEDSFHQMPFNTGDQPVGTADVDGGTYNLVYRRTSGTGGDRCGGAGSWDQFYSIRLEGKRCGTITVSDHFDVWADQGWNLGSLLEVKIVVEAAAGQGSVEFPVANVKTSL